MNLFATAAVRVIFPNLLTHVRQAVLLRHHTPGAGAAILVELPYWAYTLRRRRRQRFSSGSDPNRSLLLGELVGVPVALGALAVGRFAGGLASGPS
jgi:hypothetical protein